MTVCEEIRMQEDAGKPPKLHRKLCLALLVQSVTRLEGMCQHSAQKGVGELRTGRSL